MEALLGAALVAVSWLFVLLTLGQYRRRKGLHHLVWTVGAAMFALGATAEVVARAQGAWSETGYRLWYYAGAMQGVAFLGQGTLHLLDRRPWTHRALEVLAVLALVSLVVVLNAPLSLARLETPYQPSGRGFADVGSAGWASPRAWTVPFNLYGTVWLVGGALASAARLRRTHPPRAWGTLLIGLGGLGLAFTSSLNRLGFDGAELLGRTVGILVLLAGFALTGVEPRSLPAVRLPKVQPLAAAAVAGWALALVAFFRLEPGVWAAVVAYPGLVIVGLIVLGLFALVVGKARSRPRLGGER